MITDIWQLHWFFYLLGYLFLPRITLLFIWHFQGGNLLSYPWELYVAGWIFMPRMFIGLLIVFTTQQYGIGVLMTILGFFIDGGTKYGWREFRRRKRKKD
ncbi:hypothetical protein KAH81_10155 [bacterium]|nr:hypothetical protein [bacterium]